MSAEVVQASKFLAYVLRHRPDAIGLTLDPEGWADVDELLAAAARHGQRLTRDVIAEVVASNEKKRYAFSDDGRRIRARQGHSVTVDLGLAPTTPPATLYHGTASRFVPSIREQGLVKGQRQHVHLSADHDTAVAVGRRHGSPVVLVIDAAAMAAAGHAFYLSENHVWLTDHVPTAFITFPESPRS